MTGPDWLQEWLAEQNFSRPHWLGRICQRPKCGGRVLFVTSGWNGPFGSCERCGEPVESDEPYIVPAPQAAVPSAEAPLVLVAQAA